jgi:hypothetical protein
MGTEYVLCRVGYYRKSSRTKNNNSDSLLRAIRAQAEEIINDLKIRMENVLSAKYDLRIKTISK